MNERKKDLQVIVLAAQRKGVVDPLAERFGVSHKCLVPLHGRPLIAHVLETLAFHPLVREIVVSVEVGLFAEIERIAALMRATIPIRAVEAADNLADSVFAAAEGFGGPIVITTADNALLAPESIDAMRDALGRGDVAMAVASESAVRAAHPEGQRRFYQFRDAGFSNCNLYGLANPDALHAAEIFRGGGQFAKKASRIVSAFGILNLLFLRFKLVSLDGAMRRISRRIGLKVEATVLQNGSQAIDVDNDRTYRVVEELLNQRQASACADCRAA